MRLKRIGTSDQDLYQAQDGRVYNRKGDLIHDRQPPVPDPEHMNPANASLNTPEAD